MMDVELIYYKHLDAEEQALHDSMPHGHGTCSLIQTYQLLLLREISQHRAAADSLHRRLVDLVRWEHENEKERR